MREPGLEPQCGRADRHHEAKFVKIVPEQIAQEPLVTENTCKNIKFGFMMPEYGTILTNLASWFLTPASRSLTIKPNLFEPCYSTSN